MNTSILKKQALLLFLFLALGCLCSSYSQEYNTFQARYQNNIKGDLTFIANNIVNRDGGTSSTRPEDSYNDTGASSAFNDWLDQQYIDVDSDNTTFSSSTATFNFTQPECSVIRYAGLYWTATYPSEEAGQAIGTNRQTDFNQVKLKVPGGSYVDVVADEVLFDGFTSTDNTLRENSPYACYADITALITPLTNPQGDYTVANIRSVVGSLSSAGGAAGGWTLVVVYENPLLSGKLISTFDGFARVRNGNPVTINYGGFNTIPAGPVRVNLGAATLEGDNVIGGDRMQMRETASDPWANLSNAVNPEDNFFNSNISLNGAITTNRTPNSINTLGFDTDLFLLDNPANSVLGNSSSSAMFRFTSTGDEYYPFFNSFNIEIIEPAIVLEKKVQDIAGNDITGKGVNLGQILDYVLSFKNIGNDDAVDYTIKDILPINVTLDELNFSLPTGVGPPTYDPLTRTVIFTIPNNLVEKNDPISEIRMRVKVAENCFDFVDACTNQITNTAYSTYKGDINNNQISDDPSVTDFNDCGFAISGSTNFLLDDLSSCVFSRTVDLCGTTAVLNAGNGFDKYTWYKDENNNKLIDPADTVINDGDPDSDPSTLIVEDIGVYIVDKEVSDPCKGYQEIITVERFGTKPTNPIITLFNDNNSDADPLNDIQGEILTCSVDGKELPNIFLCGTNDTQVLQINVTDAVITWDQLNEANCTATNNGCANNSNASDCWVQVGSGNSYTADTPGEYRLVINYTNGCISRFNFNIFQNNLDIEYTKRDVICTTPGNITITNLGTGYGYQLVDVLNNVVTVPFSANNGPSFNLTSNGGYRVEMIQLDAAGDPIPNSCLFSTEEIGILQRDFKVDVSTTPGNCNNLGIINIQVLNVEPNYVYDLRFNDGTTHPYGSGTRVSQTTPQTNNNYSFNNLNPDKYVVYVTTQDGCTYSEEITVTKTPEIKLTALTTKDIGCSAGTIEVTPEGGLPDPSYSYAIWSKDGVPLYSSINDIPADKYQINPTFEFGYVTTGGPTEFDPSAPYVTTHVPNENGNYVFVVVDSNRCPAYSNSATINDNGALVIDSITDNTPVSCNGTNTASITIETTGGAAPYRYSIDGGATYQENNAIFLNLKSGTYNISVLDASGCGEVTTHTISEELPLSASAGVSRDTSCDPINGAQVRVTNVVGGMPPYVYSFDGGANYGTNNISNLLAGNFYTVIVKDDLGCEFPMEVIVEDLPVEPTISSDVVYNCDGTGNITVKTDIDTYNYTYEINSVPNTPPTSNIFNDLAPNSYRITTNYSTGIPPTPSLLLNETFGSGPTTPGPPGSTSGYFYENQMDDVTPSGAINDPDRAVADYEYTITNRIVKPYSNWINPVDHTANSASGRYLVINIGAPTPGQIIYKKVINQIIPNQPLEISLWGINLQKSGTNGTNPDLRIELRDPTTGAVVAFSETGPIPENDIWNEYILPLNPGANTTLDLVIITNESRILGNDVAIDDIKVYQTPEVCELSVDELVEVLPNQELRTTVTSFTNISCNGGNDGTITFEVANFDAGTGFEYSIDDAAFTSPTTAITSPVTTVATTHPLTAGTHTIYVRRQNEPTCIVDFTQALTEPSAVVASASITAAFTCDNTGATITASAIGGIGGYEYQLENTAATIITAYQTSPTFANVPVGSYMVRVKDATNPQVCDDLIDTQIDVVAPNALDFTLSATKCYTGNNDAEITVTVTGGNGDISYRLVGVSAFETPTPNSTTHTFSNLSSGMYTVEVTDALGCPVTPLTKDITINPKLSVTASATAITACATATDVTITAIGGDGNYVYAIVADGATPADGDFAPTNPISITVAGAYDVYVRDNNGATGDNCPASYDLNITQDTPIALDPATAVIDVTCFGGNNGSISLVATGGEAPYTYSIDNGTNYQNTGDFTNQIAGIYPVMIRDTNGCEFPSSLTIDEPDVITAEAAPTALTCPTEVATIVVGGVTPTAGGSGNYQYNLNGGVWTASTTGGTTFTGLTDGTYSVQVRDASSPTCLITLADIIIAPLPTEPVLSNTITYECDGTGNITITPFDASYTYTLGATVQTGANGNIFNNVPVGTRTINVAYGSNCNVDTTVIVADGNQFSASITGFTDPTCNGATDGTVTIAVANFGTEFQYSTDGGTSYSAVLNTSPQVINNLSTGVQNIIVRYGNDTTNDCPISLSQTLTEPATLSVTGSVTKEIDCTDATATITAVPSGGNGPYTYQLEDTAAIPNIITAYQTSPTLTGILATGDYVIKIRDANYTVANACEASSAIITVNDKNNVTFTTVETPCYDGTNTATIAITVVDGNGNYQFSIDDGSGPGPWITPATSTATTYTFTGLSNGNYTVNVKDGKNCTGTPNPVTIDPQLVVSIDALDVSSCADGSITVNATGGQGTLVYAIVPANADPTGLYTTTNTLAITNAMATANPAGYDVYVRDNNGATPNCSFIQEDIIIAPAVILTASGTPTDPECFDGLGSIDAIATGGKAPFTYALVDNSPADGINYSTTVNNVFTTTNLFSGVGVGDYQITITDANNCPVNSATITINNAVEITANIEPILPAVCNDPDPLEYGFEFDSLVTPTATLIEYSADGGTTWNTLGIEQRGYASGTAVYPSIKVTLASGTQCIKDFPRYIIPFPLDDLDITLSAVIIGCNDLQVTVEGSRGDSSSGYEYTYTDDPTSFVPGSAIWTTKIPLGTSHTFANIDPVTPQQPGLPLLVPGRTYRFYVRDGAGCVRQSNVEVNEIPGIGLPIAISTDVKPSCNTLDNGEITFTLTPRTAYPNMRWELYKIGTASPIEVSGGGASAANVTYNNVITSSVGLDQGDYYIEINQVDAGGVDACFGGSANVFVNELNAISATPVKRRDISCNLPGLIEITGITGGGGAPYTFDVSGPGGFTTLTGLTTNPVQIPVNSPAGDYTVTLYDQYGCPEVLAPAITMSLSPNPTFAPTTQDNCSAPITLNVTGNSVAGNIRYAIVANGAAAPTAYLDNSGVFTNVTPGDYDLYIIDGNGCTNMQANYTVNPVLTAKAELTKLLDCSATADATITIEALTGSGNYDYSITNTAGAPAVAKTSLATNPLVYLAPSAGDYTITLYDNTTADNAACNREFVVNVPAIVNPVFTTTTPINVTCNGDSDGSFTIIETNNSINPLTYELRYASVGNPLVPAVDYTYTATTKTYSGLAAEDYIVRAQGTNTCTTDSATITITEPALVVVDPSAISIEEFECTSGNLDNNATITVDPTGVSGGSNNFVRYVFTNTDTATVVQDSSSPLYTETNLAGGNYEIEVFDDKGCSNTTLATARIAPFVRISNPTITIDNNVTCGGNDENIDVDVVLTLGAPGAVSTIEYAITSPDTAYTSPSNSDGVFTGLGIGNYVITVTNTNTNCFVSIAHEVKDPNTFDVVIAATTDAICFGSATGTATFTVSDATYTGSYTWSVFNDNGTPLNYADDGAAIDSGDETDLVADNLIAGGHYVTFNQVGVPTCQNREPFSIAGPSATLAAGVPVVTQITCTPLNDDGIIEIVDVVGGWGNYSYFVSLTDIADQNDITNYVSTPKFENLTAGSYFIYVIDEKGCPIQLTNISLVNPTPITADLDITSRNCSNFEGVIEVINEAGGQGSNYRYQLQRWDGAAYVDLRPIQTSDVFSNLVEGQYQVIVSDQWDCSSPTTASVSLYDEMVPSFTVAPYTCAADGQITITQTGGSGGTYTYAGFLPDGTTALTSNTTGVFPGLTVVGNYTFTITETTADGVCTTANITAELKNRVYPAISVDTFNNVTCFNGADGSISVSIPDNGLTPYTFAITAVDGVATTINPTSSTGLTATFDGLSATTGVGYTVSVTGVNGCDDTIDVPITEPALVVVAPSAISTEQFECTSGNLDNNASITVDPTGVSGGSNNFVRYVFTNTDTATVVQDSSSPLYTETNLAGGNYAIEVFDDKGCSNTTLATATIAPFVTISNPTITIDNNITCGGNDEDIDVDVILTPGAPGAVSTIVYAISSPDTAYVAADNNNGVFTGLGIGNYIITVTNTNTNCFVSITHKVKDPNVIRAVATHISDETCLNDAVNEGSFSLAINNYTGAYNYQVYDINDVAQTGVSHSGIGNTGTPLTINNLEGGSYYTQITEAAGTRCTTKSNVITIVAPETQITTIVRKEASVSCTNDQGKLFVDPSGGKAPYTITIDSGTQTFTETNVQAFIFSNLSAGIFNITITDALGCTDTASEQFIEPTALSVDISPDVTLECYGDKDGVLSATLTSGGLGPIKYQLNVYDITGAVIIQTSATQVSNIFTNLPEGRYSITATDELTNCKAESPIATILDPTEVSGSLIKTQALTCTNDIELLLTADGGTAPYSWSRDGITYNTFNNGNEHRFNSLPSGNLGADTYRYYVQDIYNCTSTLSNEIKQDPVIDLDLEIDTSAAVINCNGETTGLLTARASGGLGNYSYELYYGTTSGPLDPAATPIQTSTDGVFRNLPAGFYYIRVLSVDCVYTAPEIEITEPSPLTTSANTGKTDVTCVGEDNGSILVELEGGAGDYVYAISPNLDKFDVENEFLDLEGSATGILYTVIAQDKNGCFKVLEYTILEPTIIEITPDTTVSNLRETCQGEADASVTVDIVGGTPPYRTSMDSNAVTDFVEGLFTYSDLTSGTHVLFVKDFHDCDTQLFIEIESGANLNAIVNDVYECTGDVPTASIAIALADPSVANDVLYSLHPRNPDLNNLDPSLMQLTPDFGDIAPGDYTLVISHTPTGCNIPHDVTIESFEPLQILLSETGTYNEVSVSVTGGSRNSAIYTVDGQETDLEDGIFYIPYKGGGIQTHTVSIKDDNGCLATASIEIEFIDIKIPNFFTPDGDGNNDAWKPVNQETWPEILTIIFDRYGREVYRMGLNDKGWEGFYQSTELPTGDYWYIIKLNGEKDDREFVGHFTLYR